MTRRLSTGWSRLAVPAAAVWFCLPAAGAPIGADDAPPPAIDPYDLAARWTVSSLTPRPLVPEAVAAPPAPARFRAMPYGAPQDNVPDPIGYALMGLVLLGAGLAARRWSPAQRGSSKKTYVENALTSK